MHYTLRQEAFLFYLNHLKGAETAFTNWFHGILKYFNKMHLDHAFQELAVLVHVTFITQEFTYFTDKKKKFGLDKREATWL